MKQKILPLAFLISLGLASCKHIENLKKNTSKSTNELKIPLGFTWDNSQKISLKVSVTDTRYDSAALYMIALYDADPSLGGNVITKGSASLKIAFTSTVSLPKTLSSVYIVETAPNNTVVMVKQSVTGGPINASMGALVQVPSLNPFSYPEPIDQ